MCAQVQGACAGKGAVRTALDAIATVRQRNGHDGPPHEIAHAGFISEHDYGRLSELNTTAEMSPALWHIPEFGLQDGFRFKTILSHGAEMTVGSDWIIMDSPNLFPGLQGMLQHGDQAIDLATALDAMTIAGARAVGRDTQQGSLETGKSADFIVLDRNLFEVPVEEIGGTRVLRTVFEGDTAYQDNVSHHPQESPLSRSGPSNGSLLGHQTRKVASRCTTPAKRQERPTGPPTH